MAGQIKFNGRIVCSDSGRIRSPPAVFPAPSRISVLFGDMTVIENILVGMHIHLKQTPVGTLLRLPFFKKEEADAERKAVELMHYVGLQRSRK